MAETALVAGVLALAAGGVVAGRELERRLVTARIHARHAAEDDGGGVSYFSLQSPGPDVTTPDGVVLHTEIDPPADPEDDLTVVFVHGYALSLECWHFQRVHLRQLGANRPRAVLYDQRSHGRSTRSAPERCRLPVLTDDLVQVLEEVVPPGPVVLVGHSMGGMTIMRLAQTRPELFGSRVLGVALFSTAAGEMADYSPLPAIPGRMFSSVAPGLLAALNRLPRLVERRGSGSDLSYLVTRRMSYGSAVGVDEVEFMSEMLSRTPLEVLTDFYPAFAELDEYRALEVLRRVEAAVVGGENDLILPIERTERIRELLPEADARCLPACGHMGMIEHPDVFNTVLDQLVQRVRDRSLRET
ncbi:alpha/beta fold hydrolase [uncultured Friedmanniella sp.]|uniref:alpha/beta fold hydrolase n=1 Tax=uncultured Friedmanniella sp. TaxID=335381 RepID=UPI0035C9C9E0